jgi:hypothetical protein
LWEIKGPFLQWFWGELTIDSWRFFTVSSWFTGWWFWTFGLFFPYIGKIAPTDELIFFRGVGIPPTSIHVKRFPVPSFWVVKGLWISD